MASSPSVQPVTQAKLVRIARGEMDRARDVRGCASANAVDAMD